MTQQERLDELMRKIADDYQRFNERQQEFAIREIGRIRLEIVELLAEYDGGDGTIKRQRLNRLLRDLEQIEKRVRENGMDALETVIRESAEWTTTAVTGALGEVVGASAVVGIALDKINEQTFRYVVNRFSEDGLVLSDRVWQLAGDQRDELSRVLRSGIIRGESVNTMVRKVREVYENETWKIRRLVVTEGNVANRAATGYNAQASDVVKALKITDRGGHKNHANHRCHILANQNRYGLGVGVYPKDNTEIWSPHPNCRAIVTYVLDEGVR
jgi:hypothetical protein